MGKLIAQARRPGEDCWIGINLGEQEGHRALGFEVRVLEVEEGTGFPFVHWSADAIKAAEKVHNLAKEAAAEARSVFIAETSQKVLGDCLHLAHRYDAKDVYKRAALAAYCVAVAMWDVLQSPPEKLETQVPIRLPEEK